MGQPHKGQSIEGGRFSAKTMNYVNYSIHLPDPKLLKRIKAAAKEKNVSPGAFIREAAERAVAEHERKSEKKRVAA
jgi:hypothetical protein